MPKNRRIISSTYRQGSVKKLDSCRLKFRQSDTRDFGTILAGKSWHNSCNKKKDNFLLDKDLARFLQGGNGTAFANAISMPNRRSEVGTILARGKWHSSCICKSHAKKKPCRFGGFAALRINGAFNPSLIILQYSCQVR
jgi:hypothetical protein